MRPYEEASDAQLREMHTLRLRWVWQARESRDTAAVTVAHHEKVLADLAAELELRAQARERNAS